MVENNLSQEFKLKSAYETKSYFVEEIEENKLMSKKHKKVLTLDYIAHFLILVSTVTGYISISDFTSWVGILIEIMSSAIELKLCSITAEIKKCKAIIKNKKKKYDKKYCQQKLS